MVHPIIVEKISEVENQRREREVQVYQRMNSAERSRTDRSSVTAMIKVVIERIGARIFQKTHPRDPFEAPKVDPQETSIDASA